MGTAGLRGTGAKRVKTQRPGAWRRVTIRCRGGEAWQSTVLADHTTVRCRRCGERVEIPEDP